MADNVTLNTGSGGATLAADDISGTHHQRVKVQYGADGSATDVSDTNPLPVDDAGGSLTVDNAALSVTGGGVESSAMRVTLASDSTGLLSVDDNGGSLTVDNAALSVTGGGTEAAAIRVTIANNSTGILSVDDGGSSLTVDGTVATTNAGTFAVQEDGAALTALQLLDNVVATDGSTSPTQGSMVCGHDGTNAQRIATDTAGNLQIDVISSLPAGTNNIGDVDVLSVVPGTAATNLGKAVDTAAGSTDTGVAMLAVRDDEQAAITPVDGDYTNLRSDKFGNLKTTNLPDATSVIKFGVINDSSSGDNTLQAAAGAGIKIRVLSAFMISAGTVNARFESGASGTALTGQMPLVANSGFTLPFNPSGWFETADNTLLNLELSAAIAVHGCFSYVEV